METLPSKLFLAPMSELTTPALRRTVKEFGKNIIVYSEMLSAGAIVNGGIFNEPLVTTYDFDDPLVYQIVGNSEDIMAEACGILSGKECYGIDINMGCSAPAITCRGYGAKLITDVDKAAKIVRACRRATDKKLSVKMRTGYSSNDRGEFLNFAKAMEAEGADFIVVHPRYAKLSFTRTADWSLVGFIKEKMSIPVIGNGDITSPFSAKRRLEETGCDGIMIGREAVKSPWIFNACGFLLNNSHAQSIEVGVNIQKIFISTLDYIRLYLPPALHKSRGHRFSFYFTKNLKYGHNLFKLIRNAGTIEDIQAHVNDYFTRNPWEREKTVEYAEEGTYAACKI